MIRPTLSSWFQTLEVNSSELQQKLSACAFNKTNQEITTTAKFAWSTNYRGWLDMRLHDGCFVTFAVQTGKEVPLPSASSEALLWTGRGAWVPGLTNVCSKQICCSGRLFKSLHFSEAVDHELYLQRAQTTAVIGWSHHLDGFLQNNGMTKQRFSNDSPITKHTQWEITWWVGSQTFLAEAQPASLYTGDCILSSVARLWKQLD